MYAQLERWVIFLMALLFIGSNTVAINRSVQTRLHIASEDALYRNGSAYLLYDVWEIALLNGGAEEVTASEYPAADAAEQFTADSNPAFVFPRILFSSVTIAPVVPDYLWEVHHLSALFRLYCNWRL